MGKTLYFNIEDDVKKIVASLKRETSLDFVLVFPKKSYIFSDSVNLKLLKKQTDFMGKNISILTMDEKGLEYAKEAGFGIRNLEKGRAYNGLGDIQARKTISQNNETHLTKKPLSHTQPIRKVIKKTQSLAEKTIPHVLVKDTVFPDLSSVVKEKKNKFRGMPKREYYKKMLVGFIAVFLVTIVLLVTIILPKANVVLYAKADVVSRDIEISVSTTASEADSSKLVMPGKAIERTLESSDKFTTIGKKEVGTKAKGQVKIMNLTSQPLNLKAATTTLNVNGKNYYFTEDQNGIKPIPSKYASDPDAGTLANVIAAEGGDEYNLPGGSRMEINNQVFGSKPQLLYARTEKEITGGNSRFLSVISSADIKKAQTVLVNSLTEQLRNQLGNDGQILSENGYSVDVLNFKTDKPEDTETPNFEALVKVSIKGITFSKDTLTSLIRKRIGQVMSPAKKLQDQSLDSMNLKVKNFDPKAGSMSLLVHFESRALSSLDTSGIGQLISGKSKSEAAESLLAKPEISKVEISLWPVWQTSIPRLQNKIHFTVK